jgi:hypothetical protein
MFSSFSNDRLAKASPFLPRCRLEIGQEKSELGQIRDCSRLQPLKSFSVFPHGLKCDGRATCDKCSGTSGGDKSNKETPFLFLSSGNNILSMSILKCLGAQNYRITVTVVKKITRRSLPQSVCLSLGTLFLFSILEGITPRSVVVLSLAGGVCGLMGLGTPK